MSDETEPMAIVRWDFTLNGVHYKGEHTVRRLSDAQSMVQTVNEIYGYNTHFVVPLNHTWEEVQP